MKLFHWSNHHSCLGKLSHLNNKHAQKSVHASQLNANGSNVNFEQAFDYQNTTYCSLWPESIKLIEMNVFG